MIRKTLILLVAGFNFSVAMADVKMPGIFGSGMVLQRSKPIEVWGWADKGEKVSVQFNQQSKSVKADKSGRWRLQLGAQEAGGPYKLIVKGKNSLVFDDVLVGDVWVCSGQSNMEWPVSLSIDAEKEIQAANFPQIRHIAVPKAMSTSPKQDIGKPAAWQKASPENVGSFTAVGYYFARRLHQETNIPIGLIHTSWGGTDIETWISRASLEQSTMFKPKSGSFKDPVDLEAMIKQRKQLILDHVKEKQGDFPDAVTAATWKNADLDHSKWPLIKVPGLWEPSIENFDGVVWFRTVLNVSAEDAGKPALLELARIDDSDETWLNGTRIGGMENKYNDQRVYPVSAGLLKEGANYIAVRITDNGGGGGIYGTPEEVKLTVGSKVYPLAGDWHYQVESVFIESSSNSGNVGNPNDYPTLLFNAMINPLIPYSIKGAIWYQGENNANRAYQYRSSFPLMINDWRKHWGQGDFPFYYVQLASWKASEGTSNTGSSWAELREAQTLTLATPNTGMAVTVDIGETNDIHPRNKQDVGDRLAAIALNKDYGKGNVFSGPTYQSMKVNGSKVALVFKDRGSGLLVKDKYGYLKGFEIAGADKKFYYAKATIEGDSIVVQHENVSLPVAVRYAWADDPKDANLYNKEGFPAVPFRTDSWEGITDKVTYNVK